MTKYLQEDLLRQYSQAAYAKNNFAVVANGANHQDLSKWVGQFFTESPASPPPDFPIPGSSPSKYYGGEERVAHDSGNTMILAFPGSSSFTGGSYKPEMAVLSSLLGGQSNIKWSPGFSLLSKATAANPQVHVLTTHHTYSDAGLLTVSMSGNARQVREVGQQVVTALKNTAAGKVSSEDIKKARAAAKFKALESGQNIDTGIELTGAGLVQGGKAFQIDEVGKGMDGVTEDQVKKVCLSNFDLRLSLRADTYISTGCESAIRWESFCIYRWRFICSSFCGRNRPKRVNAFVEHSSYRITRKGQISHKVRDNCLDVSNK